MANIDNETSRSGAGQRYTAPNKGKAMERCIRCEGEFELGFLIDKGDGNATSQAQWASGEPNTNTSFWRLSAIRSDSQILPVSTYRCKSCGRLESFAHTAA